MPQRFLSISAHVLKIKYSFFVFYTKKLIIQLYHTSALKKDKNEYICNVLPRVIECHYEMTCICFDISFSSLALLSVLLLRYMFIMLFSFSRTYRQTLMYYYGLLNINMLLSKDGKIIDI